MGGCQGLWYGSMRDVVQGEFHHVQVRARLFLLLRQHFEWHHIFTFGKATLYFRCGAQCAPHTSFVGGGTA